MRLLKAFAKPIVIAKSLPLLRHIGVPSLVELESMASVRSI
jgi:hypothetical protein